MLQPYPGGVAFCSGVSTRPRVPFRDRSFDVVMMTFALPLPDPTPA